MAAKKGRKTVKLHKGKKLEATKPLKISPADTTGGNFVKVKTEYWT